LGVDPVHTWRARNNEHIAPRPRVQVRFSRIVNLGANGCAIAGADGPRQGNHGV
jgi:hypothetical protein